MRPLATTQQMMTWLSMCPVGESTTLWQKRAHIAHTLAILIINSTSFVASLAYCIKFFTVDFDGAVFGFMNANADSGVIYFMMVAIRLRVQIDGIFKELSNIYKCSKFNSHDE